VSCLPGAPLLTPICPLLRAGRPTPRFRTFQVGRSSWLSAARRRHERLLHHPCYYPVIIGRRPSTCRQPIGYNRLTNVDGYQFFCRRVSGKAVGIVARAGARGTCVALLLDPSAGQITETTLGDVEAAARPKGLQIQVLNVQTSRDINAAFTTFMRERPDAFFVGPGPFFTSRPV
jgi:hypothetical protein